MRALAGLLVEVAAGDHVVDRQADPGVKLAAELEDVGFGVRGVKVRREDGGGLLEERVVIVPGAQFINQDAGGVGEFDVDGGLGEPEGLAGEGVQLVEESQDVIARLFVQEELHRVKIGESERPRGLVAQQDEGLQIGLDDRPDALAGLPDLFPFDGVFRGLEHLADLAIGQLAAVDPGAVGVERLLDGVGAGGDLAEEGGVHLLFKVDQVKNIDRARDLRVVDFRGLQRLESGERLVVGEGGVKPVLGVLLGLEIGVLAGDVGVPPGEVRGAFERADTRLVLLHERAGAGDGRKVIRLGDGRGATHEKDREDKGSVGHGSLFLRVVIGCGRSIVMDLLASRKSAPGVGPFPCEAPGTLRRFPGFCER